MFIPFSTEHSETKRLPLANVAIVVFTILVSLSFFEDGRLASVSEGWVARLIIHRGAPSPLQLIGHTLVHGDGWHLAGNMLVLLAMGNAVNARLGHLAYLALYATSAIVGALAWLAAGDGAEAAGASGAILGVVGAFLVLFPLTQVNVMFWLPGLALTALVIVWRLVLGEPGFELVVASLVVLACCACYSVVSLMDHSPPEGAVLRILGLHTAPVSGCLVVLVTIAMDVLGLVLGLGGVGFEAHLGGAAVGVAVGLGLVLTKVIKGTHTDPTLIEWLGLAPMPTRPRFRRPLHPWDPARAFEA